MIFRIYANFNRKTIDERGDKILIGKKGSWQIERFPIKTALQTGAPIILYDGEISVEATIEFNNTDEIWYGRPNWSTRRDLESRSTGIHWYKDATPEQKLGILRYEGGLILKGIQGCIDVLVDRNLIEKEFPEKRDKLLNDLASLANDLKTIMDELTE